MEDLANESPKLTWQRPADEGFGDLEQVEAINLARDFAFEVDLQGHESEKLDVLPYGSQISLVLCCLRNQKLRCGLMKQVRKDGKSGDHGDQPAGHQWPTE